MDVLGYLIREAGHNFSFIASFINENVPEIKAWLAMMVAIVAMMIPTNKNWWGMME